MSVAVPLTKLIEKYDGSSTVLQVDFSENTSIVNQNETQSTHWSHQQFLSNFFATSYGKGAVDGISGTVKHLFWRNVCFTAAIPNDAVAHYKLAKSLNMGIVMTYISSDN